MLTLREISSVLGVSKPVASALKNNKYSAQKTLARFDALQRIVNRVSQQNHQTDPGQICASCPREDCTGCRIAQLTD